MRTFHQYKRVHLKHQAKETSYNVLYSTVLYVCMHVFEESFLSKSPWLGHCCSLSLCPAKQGVSQETFALEHVLHH